MPKHRALLPAVLLFSSAIANAGDRPQAGRYIFSQPHQIQDCRRFDAENYCIESDMRAFGFKEKIDVEKFLWDKKSKSWSAQAAAWGKFRAIPMDVLHLYSACDKLMDEYQFALNRAPKACRADTDCSLYPSPDNSCAWPQAANENKKVRALLERLEAAIPKGGCLILHPPCAAVPVMGAKCVKSSCVAEPIGGEKRPVPINRRN